MPSEFSNDNGGTERQQGSDAHGQAALLLVESLVHGLIAREVLTVADAVEIVDVAVEVKAEQGHDHDVSPDHLRQSLGLLTAISTSLQRDLPRD